MSKQNEQINEIKIMNIRLPKSMWSFLRQSAFDQQTSMNEIILRCLLKYKENRERLLTSKDITI